MRCVLLTNFIPPYRISLYRALRARLGDLRVLISVPTETNRRWVPDWADLDVIVQRTVSWRKSWKHPQGFTESGIVHFPWDTIPRLIEYRPEVIISGELGLRTVQAVLYRMVRAHTKLLIWATVSEVTESNRGFARTLLRQVLVRRCDAVVVNGASGARYIEALGVPPSRIFEVPYTTDVSMFAERAISTETSADHELLYVGQLIERKGLLPFIEVLVKWARAHTDKTIAFTIAGHGPEDSSIQGIEKPANLSVNLIGHVDYEGLPDLYHRSSILVFPTFADEWGVVVNEAMAGGLVVLGSLYSQAVEELVEDDRNGWIFRPDDPDDVFAAIDRALTTDDGRMHLMRLAARERAVQVTPDSAADRLVRAIESS